MTVRQSFHQLTRLSRWVLPKSQTDVGTRGLSSLGTSSSSLRKSELFTAEKKKQHEDIGRIEKIQVHVESDFGDEHLMMNKDLSTPYDCARHISDHVCKQSVVALVDDSRSWDMHRPLTGSCNVKFLKNTDKNPWTSNNTFWRSCSFMLGAVVSEAFREDISVILHSFPSPNVSSGSFILDAYIGLETWNPSPEELRALSAEMIKLSDKELPFERLSISQETAEEMFADNPYKLSHIPKIFDMHNEVVVYRVGSHVDISRGPMMNHTGLLGRCTIASVHHLKEDDLYRFQGVALPKGLKLNHYAYGILENRARFLNDHMLPSQAGQAFQPSMEFAMEAREVQPERQP